MLKISASEILSAVTLGKGTAWGKNSTVSAFILPLVDGMKHS